MDLVKDGCKSVAFDLEVVAALEIHSEALGGAEVPKERSTSRYNATRYYRATLWACSCAVAEPVASRCQVNPEAI
jgi:hypothetical protein